MNILIVEDDIKIANSLKKGFENESFVVDHVADGREALSKLKYNDFDVVILDIMIPGIDGLEVLHTCRQKKIYTPIIMLTALDTTEDKIKALNAGADDYVPKPFSFEELLARVRALIRRATTKESILIIDTLTLDPHTRKVTRSGQEIALSAKEYLLLEYLMHHPDVPLSEQTLLEHIWDVNFETYSNLIAVHIKNLRNKIDRNFTEEKSLIQTVRGFGYKISGK